jgi:LysR family hydrogen peroxide-inducible transcriptional activator
MTSKIILNTFDHTRVDAEKVHPAFIDNIYNLNIQQLEYIIAVDHYRHFANAADACFVTQATLSMMIKKLEQELNCVLFDRSRQPVVPTDTGEVIIAQAKLILKEWELLRQIPANASQKIEGELKIGIIPTLAPYLLPLFLSSFLQNYPLVKLKIQEQNTEELLRLLSSGKLDAGIMATPIHDHTFKEKHLFNETFRVYVSQQEKTLKRKFILPEEIDINRLWLLEEGHCLRSQILNLCELQQQQAKLHQLDYETGSIESLMKITEIHQGITIIPELATVGFDQSQKNRLRYFMEPVPAREISIVTYRHHVKENLLDALEVEIKEGALPFLSKPKKQQNVLPIKIS